jgi:serine/threonine protein kinase
MLIADFGLSKEESLITSNSLVNGMPAYIDPQSYMRDRYKRNKKSDIFSLGMILWEISSEKVPFAGYSYSQVVLKISKGIREERVDGTPDSYCELYTRCWDNDPEKRPNIEEVVEFLSNYRPPQPQQLISAISCETLTIGSIVSSTNPLFYYSLTQKVFTYYISSEKTQVKMDFPLHNVFSFEYRPIDDVHSQIVIEVKDSPFFFGERNLHRYFTEDKQASRHERYVLKGRADLMKPQLIKLVRDDQSLANVVVMMDTPALNDPLNPMIILMLLYKLILQLIFFRSFRRFSRILRFNRT